MHPLFSALISTLLVSLLGLIGFFTLFFSDEKIKKILIPLVSFSAGGLMGGAFFHLLPEAITENCNVLSTFTYLIMGFCLFFILEKFLRWHHCHDKHCTKKHHLGYINLIGDGLHNFIDGVIIASAFMANIPLGVATTISIISHEIPQEMGDFGVLLYSGMKKTRALLYNYLVAAIAILGALAGYFLINLISGLNAVLIPLAAGGFIYIAASDLIPELQEELNAKRSVINFGIFILALAFMFVIKIIGE